MKYYRSMVSTGPNFASTKFVDNTLADSTSYLAHSKNHLGGPLDWRVNGVDGFGNELTASEVRRLTKTSPATALVAPSPHAAASGTP